tara:strand:- start:16901 stop:17335 length:435 start_codon:yes stop_codon:yes gene_type:complete
MPAQYIGTIRVRHGLDWMTVMALLRKLEGWINRRLVSSRGWKKRCNDHRRIYLVAVMEGLSSSHNNHNHLIWLSKSQFCEDALQQGVEKFVSRDGRFYRPWITKVETERLPGLVSYMNKEHKMCEFDLGNPEFPDRIYWPGGKF